MRTWKQERVISCIFQATSKLGWKLKKCEWEFAALLYVLRSLRGERVMGGLVQSILVFRVSLPIRREPVVFILDSLLENKTKLWLCNNIIPSIAHLDPVPVVSLRGSRPESVLQYLGIFRFPGGRREVAPRGTVVTRLEAQYERGRGVEDWCRGHV